MTYPAVAARVLPGKTTFDKRERACFLLAQRG
jgi:hypothetical protein